MSAESGTIGVGDIAARMVKRAFLEAEIQMLAHELSRGGFVRLDEDRVEARLRQLVRLAQEAV